MKISHRGLTIDLPDDDGRVAIIETVLYGKPLPPPLPTPELAKPPVPVPPAFRNFWRAINAKDRQELVLLADDMRTPMELEKLLGFQGSQLSGRHSALARVAAEHGVGKVIQPRGRGRSERRFGIAAEVAAWVRALAAEGAAG